jgi:hypothetical protein
MAHRRRMNQESSSNRLAFQVAHTTISRNYTREVRNPRSPDLGRLYGCAATRWRNRRVTTRA